MQSLSFRKLATEEVRTTIEDEIRAKSALYEPGSTAWLRKATIDHRDGQYRVYVHSSDDSPLRLVYIPEAVLCEPATYPQIAQASPGEVPCPGGAYTSGAFVAVLLYTIAQVLLAWGEERVRD